MLLKLLRNNLSNSQNKFMQKLKDKNTRKLIKMGRNGGSLGLTLPKEIVTSLSWKEKQKLTVKKVRGGVLIKDWKK